MTHYATRGCDCEAGPIYQGGKRPDVCEHGNRYLTAAQLNPPERKPINRVSEKRQAEIDAGMKPRTGSTMSKGRGFAASPEQRAKVRNRPCVACGRDCTETDIHAAHVCARRLAPHCDCAEGVVPLCSRCHALYDDPNQPFDLLPALVEHEYFAEAVHGFTTHGVGWVELLNHSRRSKSSTADAKPRQRSMTTVSVPGAAPRSSERFQPRRRPSRRSSRRSFARVARIECSGCHREEPEWLTDRKGWFWTSLDPSDGLLDVFCQACQEKQVKEERRLGLDQQPEAEPREQEQKASEGKDGR